MEEVKQYPCLYEKFNRTKTIIIAANFCLRLTAAILKTPFELQTPKKGHVR